MSSKKLFYLEKNLCSIYFNSSYLFASPIAEFPNDSEISYTFSNYVCIIALSPVRLGVTLG